MNVWKTVKMGDFLSERCGKYEPGDKEILGLKRIHKIDFYGQFCIVTKPSRTKMIRVEPGDLVISGINVAKGALGIYEEKKPVAATIHYSSYFFSFDKVQVNSEYFKYFLKSPIFKNRLKELVKGGIKTEIKAKHLLPLTIPLPEIDEQDRILRLFSKIEQLKNEISFQQSLVDNIYQQIFQDAAESDSAEE